MFHRHKRPRQEACRDSHCAHRVVRPRPSTTMVWGGAGASASAVFQTTSTARGLLPHPATTSAARIRSIGPIGPIGPRHHPIPFPFSYVPPHCPPHPSTLTGGATATVTPTPATPHTPPAFTTQERRLLERDAQRRRLAFPLTDGGQRVSSLFDDNVLLEACEDWRTAEQVKRAIASPHNRKKLLQVLRELHQFGLMDHAEPWGHRPPFFRTRRDRDAYAQRERLRAQGVLLDSIPRPPADVMTACGAEDARHTKAGTLQQQQQQQQPPSEPELDRETEAVPTNKDGSDDDDDDTSDADDTGTDTDIDIDTTLLPRRIRNLAVIDVETLADSVYAFDQRVVRAPTDWTCVSVCAADYEGPGLGRFVRCPDGTSAFEATFIWCVLACAERGRLFDSNVYLASRRHSTKGLKRVLETLPATQRPRHVYRITSCTGKRVRSVHPA